MPLLSVIIPVYNEAKTLLQIIERADSVPIDKEIIVVDDGSSDGTAGAIKGIKLSNLKVIHHGSNRGKGAAVRTGLDHAHGEYVIIQDADLEYNPEEYVKLFEEMQKGSFDLVLGARFTSGYRGLLIPRLGNRFLTTLMNILFGCRLNDYLTCYKLLRRDTIASLSLKSEKFDIETELVVKALKKRLRISQVPISYVPRSYSEGKKIRLKDGLFAIYSILKYRFKKV